MTDAENTTPTHATAETGGVFPQGVPAESVGEQAERGVPGTGVDTADLLANGEDEDGGGSGEEVKEGDPSYVEPDEDALEPEDEQ